MVPPRLERRFLPVACSLLLAVFPFFSAGDAVPSAADRQRVLLDRHPLHPLLFRHYLDMLSREGRLAEAREYVDARRLAEPHNPLPGIMDGYLLILSGETTSGVAQLAGFHGRALAAEVVGLLEDIYTERRFWREAAALLGAHPADPVRTGQRRFRYLMLAGERDAAIQALVPVLVGNPDLGTALLFAEAGQAVDAEAAAGVLRKAAAAAVGSEALALTRVLVRILVHLGRPEEALACGISLGGGIGHPTLVFLVQAMDTFAVQDGPARLLEPLRDGPLEASLRIRLVVERLRRDPATALPLIEALPPEVGDADRLRLRARAYARLGRYREAAAAFAEIREKTAGDQETLGCVLLALALPEEARAQFSRLPQPRQGTGMALAALLSGDREQAGRQLDAALAGPNDGSAYRDALELVFLMRGAPATNQMIRLARSRIAEACGGMESAASNQADLAGLSHAAFWKERAWLAEALALQAAGRIDGALAGFRRLSGPLAPHGLYRRAALLRRLPGREGEAAETFMDLIARYPASPYLFEARRFLAEQP